MPRKKRDKRFDQPLLDLGPAEINQLRLKGLSLAEIADLKGVTRQAVSKMVQRYNGFLTPRQQVQEAWPFKTSRAHNRSTVYHRLRDHGEFMATGGRGMAEWKLERLEPWWEKMEGVVVEFDPSPQPGLPVGGFVYRRRRRSDADLLIRRNEHTVLTDKGLLIWRLPPPRDTKRE